MPASPAIAKQHGRMTKRLERALALHSTMEGKLNSLPDDPRFHRKFKNTAKAAIGNLQWASDLMQDMDDLIEGKQKWEVEGPVDDWASSSSDSDSDNEQHNDGSGGDAVAKLDMAILRATSDNKQVDDHAAAQSTATTHGREDEPVASMASATVNATGTNNDDTPAAVKLADVLHNVTIQAQDGPGPAGNDDGSVGGGVPVDAAAGADGGGDAEEESEIAAVERMAELETENIKLRFERLIVEGLIQANRREVYSYKAYQQTVRLGACIREASAGMENMTVDEMSSIHSRMLKVLNSMHMLQAPKEGGGKAESPGDGLDKAERGGSGASGGKQEGDEVQDQDDDVMET